MNRTALLMVAASLAGAAGLQAQTTNPLIGEMKRAYTQYKGYWTKVAASMPEENYSFKPVPEIRSFGEMKRAYTQYKGYWTKVAASMPEENYSFKPVPEIRSFGEMKRAYTQYKGYWTKVAA